MVEIKQSVPDPKLIDRIEREKFQRAPDKKRIEQIEREKRKPAPKTPGK